MNPSRSQSIRRLSAILTLGAAAAILSLSGVRTDQAQAGATLPPTWTPVPTKASQTIPTVNVVVPTIPPTITAPAVYVESGSISATLFYLSKRGASTVYLAQTTPGAATGTSVSKTTDNVTAFDISKDSQVAYGTSKGALMVAGRTTWQAPSSPNPLSVASVAWSPDGQTVAFSLRASDADFLTNAKQEVSGVYLWKTGDAQPSQFIADLVAGNGGHYQYTVQSWSPDGSLLLVKFAETVSSAYGWITASISPKNSFGVATFKASDPVRYLGADWTSDNGVVVFNQDTTALTSTANGLVVDQSGNRSRPLVVSDPLDKAPVLASNVKFLTGNDVFVLGSSGRDKPLQPYIGSYDPSSATIAIKPIAEAFKLKWPGIVITSQDSFPIYILDDQYGVVLFKDGSIFPYYPSDLGMNALDSAVYDTTFFPDWKFAGLGVTPKLPTP